MTFYDRYLWNNNTITHELKSVLLKNRDLSDKAALKEGKEKAEGIITGLGTENT